MRSPDRSYLWLALTAALAVAAILLGGCERQPPTDIRTVVGDSLTMTAALDGGFPPGYDVHSMLGWQAENAQPGLTERVADPRRSPCAAAIALGQNDASAHLGGPGDGWTLTDAQQMRALRDTFHPATNVLWVLPDYDGTDPAYVAGIETYRAWVIVEAARWGDMVADWRTVNRPEHIDSDGVHLTPAGRLAYGAFITEEIPDCG